jgi:death-on-curing protein
VSGPIWLDTFIVLDVHAEQLALFGGADGVRDAGLLESALARPLNKLVYGETNLAALAAAYAFGIARNHPSPPSSYFSVSTGLILMCRRRQRPL